MNPPWSDRRGPTPSRPPLQVIAISLNTKGRDRALLCLKDWLAVQPGEWEARRVLSARYLNFRSKFREHIQKSRPKTDCLFEVGKAGRLCTTISDLCLCLLLGYMQSETTWYTQCIKIRKRCFHYRIHQGDRRLRLVLPVFFTYINRRIVLLGPNNLSNISFPVVRGIRYSPNTDIALT